MSEKSLLRSLRIQRRARLIDMTTQSSHVEHAKCHHRSSIRLEMSTNEQEQSCPVSSPEQSTVSTPPPSASKSQKPKYGNVCCAAKWCNNKRRPGIRMFGFPKDKRKELWIAYANRPEFLKLSDSKIQQRRLCSEHFDRSAFLNTPHTSLKRNAVPSVPVTNKRLQFLVAPGRQAVHFLTSMFVIVWHCSCSTSCCL